MSIEVTPVQRMRVWQETTFATDGTGTLGNFQDVPFVEGTAAMAINKEPLNPAFAVQHIDDYPEQLFGPKRATLSFQIPFLVTGTAAGDSTGVTQNVLGYILETVLGGRLDPIGGTVDTAASEDDFDLVGSTTFSVGGCLGVTQSGAHHLREIDSSSGGSGAIRLKVGLPSTPSGSDVVYACDTYYPTANPTGSLQFIVEGLENRDRFLLLGGQLESLTLDDLGPGQIPKLTFNLQFADWQYGDDADTDLTGSSLGFASYDDANALVVMDSEFRVATLGSRTLSGTLFHSSSITVTPAFTYIPQTTPAGTNTIARWVRQRVAPAVEGSFVVPLQDDYSWFDARDGSADMAIFYQIGSSAPGSCMMLSIPTVQITNVQPADANGIRSQTVSWRARNDEETGNSNDNGLAAFRIHLQ